MGGMTLAEFTAAVVALAAGRRCMAGEHRWTGPERAYSVWMAWVVTGEDTGVGSHYAETAEEALAELRTKLAAHDAAEALASVPDGDDGETVVVEVPDRGTLRGLPASVRVA